MQLKFVLPLIAATLALALPAQADNARLRVAGNLVATGLIQQTKEQPFFENFAKNTGLPIDADYKPMDVLGVKDADGLRVLKSGLFDIVTLRLAQVSRDEPFFLGPDIVGLSTDYEVARKVVDAYREAFDKRLQERHGGKLLGLYPFGPQVVFCKVAIGGLADLKGKKVRVYDQSLAKFIEKLGGIPVTIPFGETQQALERGVTDCAITGPSSANSAGWPEVTTHFMPIGFQIALNAYAINLQKWNALSAEQKTKLTDAFRKFETEVWGYSKELFDDASRCNVGKEPCKTVKKFAMKDVPVKPGDQQMIRDALTTVSLPIWSELCDKSYDKCSATWKQVVGPVVGLK
ncbi:TRAP-type C4-dicarboxylate transport system substrate-binding protein [Variovorax boronicumulans]|uniref:TRAP-type C4-dicarboxylate transport system substrate-binding protein n=1 Tax=Variovorax boronicumulans TaxID=436515 RepID=A0AAW8DR74_9BURK|nr:TRAP transporter substrate-binding protein [Variovorax boronicumulans]MDP9876468.1 TRAP-type C4-dicarboxylate transport system substrate-binding protein [Variovorax boronicumulans]MDP9921752.1 TRAP-type C4-dicarboxylate transport system substrate-binding protein [Variovorax boronicumulans]